MPKSKSNGVSWTMTFWLKWQRRDGILPETWATGGVLCAPDLANVGPRGYSPETTANCRGCGDSVFIDDAVVVVVVVEAELFAAELGWAFYEESVWSKEAEMEELLLRRETNSGGMG
ncbi:hypothetical protein RHSIM_Rhsim02G0115900 [Rhododendron simsii]|uniref:Uncharacterized protein n=1 Tax=Rhododendron simsii TaxID=118357 RepID=A0A834HAA2_RHOSS|nr:hypothetical protein RHSIM_Rhsim02G0115900 [Rhododendron simsii]